MEIAGTQGRISRGCHVIAPPMLRDRGLELDLMASWRNSRFMLDRCSNAANAVLPSAACERRRAGWHTASEQGIRRCPGILRNLATSADRLGVTLPLLIEGG
jgi:hypothetical protein